MRKTFQASTTASVKDIDIPRFLKLLCLQEIVPKGDQDSDIIDSRGKARGVSHHGYFACVSRS